VEFIHRNDLDLWTPDRAKLSEADAAELDWAWHALRGSDESAAPGLFQITDTATRQSGDTQTFESFPSELRAMHARLLSRPAGRELLKELLLASDLGPAVSIEPVHPQLLTNEGPVAATNTKEYRGGLATPNGPGTSSASTIAIPSGLRDMQLTNVDVEGHRIAAPTFVVYGHELIHALANIRGENRHELNEDLYGGRNAVQQPNKPQLTDWRNEEEMFTIMTRPLSENKIREEHGLSERWGHREPGL
jgi:hypothetical protein